MNATKCSHKQNLTKQAEYSINPCYEIEVNGKTEYCAVYTGRVPSLAPMKLSGPTLTALGWRLPPNHVFGGDFFLCCQLLKDFPRLATWAFRGPPLLLCLASFCLRRRWAFFEFYRRIGYVCDTDLRLTDLQAAFEFGERVLNVPGYLTWLPSSASSFD